MLTPGLGEPWPGPGAQTGLVLFLESPHTPWPRVRVTVAFLRCRDRRKWAKKNAVGGKPAGLLASGTALFP